MRDNSRNLEKLYFDGLEGVIGSLSSADSAARPELASKANFDEWKSSPKGKSAALLNVHGIRGIKTLDDKGYLNIKFEKHVLQRLKFLTYNNIIQKSRNFLTSPVGGDADGKLKLVPLEEQREAATPLITNFDAIANCQNYRYKYKNLSDNTLSSARLG